MNLASRLHPLKMEGVSQFSWSFLESHLAASLVSQPQVPLTKAQITDSKFQMTGDEWDSWKAPSAGQESVVNCRDFGQCSQQLCQAWLPSRMWSCHQWADQVRPFLTLLAISNCDILQMCSFVGPSISLLSLKQSWDLKQSWEPSCGSLRVRLCIRLFGASLLP